MVDPTPEEMDNLVLQIAARLDMTVHDAARSVKRFSPLSRALAVATLGTRHGRRQVAEWWDSNRARLKAEWNIRPKLEHKIAMRQAKAKICKALSA